VNTSNVGHLCALVLFTTGISLMIVGSAWVIVLGVTLIILSNLRRPWTPETAASLSVLVALLVINFIRSGPGFPRQSVDLWYVVAMADLWLCRVIVEVRRWRADWLKSDTCNLMLFGVFQADS
jgi:hypothetical protein